MGRVRSSPARSRVPWRLRLLLDPAALRYWLVVVVLAVALALVVGRSLAAATDARARWGRTETVLVAAHRIEPGQPLTDAVRTERWPKALIPEEVVAAVSRSDEAGVVIDAGAALTPAMVRDPSVDRERRSLAIPADQVLVPVAVGDVVDLWSTGTEPFEPTDERTTRRIASDAQVVDQTDRALVVTVDPDEVADVATALAADGLAVAGPGCVSVRRSCP